MQGKHFISDPTFLVDALCKSIILQNPALCYDDKYKVVFRSQTQAESKVTILSGGGSGHEPAHAGYVGQGMLDAAVCGAVFASPNVNQILQGLHHISSPRGTLIIVKNYTGDKLNFGLAAEEHRARTGKLIRMIMVGDDVAVPRSKGKMVGRRGLAGTVLVHKIAGAAAAQGYSLDDVALYAQYVADNLATVGISLDFCTIPGATGSSDTSIPQESVELGMGIHNEPGTRRLSPQPDIQYIVMEMLKTVLDTTDTERNFVRFDFPPLHPTVALLVNNLGGLSVLEVQAITFVVLDTLRKIYQIVPNRIFMGTYLSSLDGPGFSITLLNLGSESVAVTTGQLIEFLDFPVEVPCWTPSLVNNGVDGVSHDTSLASTAEVDGFTNLKSIPCSRTKLQRVVDCVYDEVVRQEPVITRHDTLMGDGDCGTTLLAGAEAVRKVVQSTDSDNLSHHLICIASAVREAMGGTSGALYGLFFSSFVSAVQELYNPEIGTGIPLFATAAQRALTNLERFTNAREGSRTLMDALIPFVHELRLMSQKSTNTAEVLCSALLKSTIAMQATQNMQSSFGRSTYVGADTGTGSAGVQDPTKGIPDPGACGVVAIVTGLLAAFK